jgi:4a-hydroxytetrahydrobiopterin dehydratase
MPASEVVMKLSDEERAAALAALPEWSFDAAAAAIRKSFTFRDFSEAFAFMTQIALAAEKADHHPDWSNSWNKVEIALTTHSAHGLTRLDVEMAAAIDTLAARLLS